MQKTILLTGATDGIGLETAIMLVAKGHHVLLHGRNPAKLKAVEQSLKSDQVETYVTDLSKLGQVETLASQVISKHDSLDVVINNAGIFKTSTPITDDGLDVRFAVNTIAPYILTQRLLPIMKASGRVVNVASAAQSPVNLEAMRGKGRLSDFEAYGQSKLAIIMWTNSMASDNSQMMVSVNPGSLLGSKMVKEGFGVEGKDVSIGADILVRAALSQEFEDASGKYYDNDSQQFAKPHLDALSGEKCNEVVTTIDTIISEHTG